MNCNILNNLYVKCTVMQIEVATAKFPFTPNGF